MLNLIKGQESDCLIDKIYLYAKNLSEPKYQFLIKKCENVPKKHLNDSKAFTEHSQCMDDVYNNTDDYKSSEKTKVLIVFDDMIADIMSNKKVQYIIKELFIRCRKLNISLVFITQSYFSAPKEVNNEDSQQKRVTKIVTNHSADINYKDFIEIFRKCSREAYSFLTIDTKLPSDNPLRYRENLLVSL